MGSEVIYACEWVLQSFYSVPVLNLKAFQQDDHKVSKPVELIDYPDTGRSGISTIRYHTQIISIFIYNGYVWIIEWLNVLFFTSLIKSMFCSSSSIYVYIMVIYGIMIIMVTFIILYFVDLFKSSHLLYYMYYSWGTPCSSARNMDRPSSRTVDKVKLSYCKTVCA